MSDNAWDDESVAAVLSKTNELLDKGLSTEETVKILVQAGLDSETAASMLEMSLRLEEPLSVETWVTWHGFRLLYSGRSVVVLWDSFCP